MATIEEQDSLVNGISFRIKQHSEGLISCEEFLRIVGHMVAIERVNLRARLVDRLTALGSD